MPTDKQTHMFNKKNKMYKKCGAKIQGTTGSVCRHTAKKNGRCLAHSNLTIVLKQKKDLEKKLARRNKKAQEIKKVRESTASSKPVNKPID